MSISLLWACASAVSLILVVSVNESKGSLVANGANVCSRFQSFAQQYQRSYQMSWKRKSSTGCGLWGWGRCTVYRTVYGVAYRTATRQAYKPVYFCCPGWKQQGSGCPTVNTSTCPSLPAPSNGTKLGCPGNTIEYYNTVCQFSCNNGYIGSGSQVRRCQQNGTWSGQEFVCQQMHGGWSKWGNWTECSVTCGVGVMSRERHCDNPIPPYGGRPCEGLNKDSKSCSTGEVCIAEVGCYDSFPSDLLGNFTDEIDYFAHFSSQMQKIIKKCGHLAAKKRQRFFAVEDFGNCYGAHVFPFGSASKATQCNFGVGLPNYYYVYEISS